MKKNKFLLVSEIFGSLYLFFLIYKFLINILNFQNFTKTLISIILIILIVPHILLVILGLIFNAIAFASNLKWSALVSGIFYSLAILVMPLYFIFLLPSLILCFYSFSKMNKTINEFTNPNEFIQK